MFEINKTYKLQDFKGTYYTATILEETETQIVFTNLFGQRELLDKAEIKRFKEEVKQ